jgi:N-acyl-D-amino-acid deacylase
MWIYSARETEQTLIWPWTTVGADGASSTPGGGVGGMTVHPRSWGTFPKFLREFHLEERRLSLEEAIRKLTGLPAEIFSLTDRGLIRPGAKADLAVFDPREIEDTATYTDPRQTARGMRYVFVNGELTVDQGRRTARRPGRVLGRG